MTTTLRTMTEMTTDPEYFAADDATEATPSMGNLHLTIKRKEFLAAFGKVSPVVPARSPRPILQNIKLVADENGVTLSGTDLEVGVRHKVYGVTVLSPGAAILPTAKVSSIFSSCPDVELDLAVEGDHIVIRSASATFRLPSEASDLFPEVPSFATEAYFEVSAGDLRTCIKRTIFACDAESTRYALGGCLVEFADHAMTMVATDGRRLAKMVVPCDAVGGATAPEKGPVVPAKALKLIDKNLDDPDLTVHIAVLANDSAVLVRTSDRSVTIYSRLVEGRFPDYKSVFPDASSAVKIPVEVGAFSQAVQQASIVTSEESRGTDLRWATGSLTLASQAADVGSSQVTLPVGHDGPPVDITFDCRYLTDALKTMDDDATITAELIDGSNAAVFRTEDGFSYVVMPLTRTR